TEVGHDSMAPTLVNGYPGAGSYLRTISYEMDMEQIDELIARAQSCEQYIKYECYQSRLLSNPGSDPSWGWWVSRSNLSMDYWGGSYPGSGACACAQLNECQGLPGNTNPCNCDAGFALDGVFDDGFLTHKEHLPVLELRFGDTGTAHDQKWGVHTLGPLRCTSDNLFDNVVTFHEAHETIALPTLGGTPSSDVRFQFKTKQSTGNLLQSTGNEHFVEIKLVSGNTIHFRFSVGSGMQTLEKVTAYPLNDDNWHTLYVERNRKQAILQL
ncbi:hypothetical protein CAPTEDRAFT_45779, partial [Capitella teleta]